MVLLRSNWNKPYVIENFWADIDSRLMTFNEKYLQHITTQVVLL